MRFFSILSISLLILAAGCGGGSPPDPLLGKSGRPSVLVILLDALRADACTSLGYDRETTPRIDALAAEGALLTKTYSQAPYTVTSIASMMTGLHPPRHAVHGLYDRLDRKFTTLAELFQEGGYSTAAITASPVVSGQYGLRQGFDKLTEIYKLPEIREKYDLKENEVFYHVQAGDFLELAVSRLDSFEQEKDDGSGEGKPFFLYLHYLQPHTPYAPPEPFGSRFVDPGYGGAIDGEVTTVRSINGGELRPDEDDLKHLRALYDGNLAYVDDEVGKLFDELKRRELYDDLLIVVLSDHGEAFGEHQFCGHNYTVQEEMVRVPWYWKFPEGATAAGLRSDAMVELVDLLPTLADMLDLPGAGAEMDGVSLAPLLRGEVEKVKEYSFFRTIHDMPEWGICDGRFKLIWSSGDRTSRLFDLESDPGEHLDLLASDGGAGFTDRARIMEERLLAKLAEGTPGGGAGATLDEETMKRLKALGYIND